jgi:hypothetical protein
MTLSAAQLPISGRRYVAHEGCARKVHLQVRPSARVCHEARASDPSVTYDRASRTAEYEVHPFVKGQNVHMDLESATDELYGVTPAEFTAARNAMAADARKAVLAAVAASVKQLRKPSAGAWLANLLVRQRSDEIDRLLELGESLRGSGPTQGGDEIRKVSKQKIDAVSKLIRYAKSRASQSGHPASSSAIVELEMTLDAAFADPEAAATLRQGRLTIGLRYSGLGFTAQPGTGSTARTSGSGSPRDSKSEAHQIAARRDLDKANHEAEKADAHLEKARKAVKEAAAELTRLKSEEVQAAQRSRDAHARAAAAKKGLSKGL